MKRSYTNKFAKCPFDKCTANLQFDLNISCNWVAGQVAWRQLNTPVR